MFSQTSIAKKILTGIMIAILGVAAILGLTYLIMWLWNSILPDILHVGHLGYWQALGLFILCKILFGGFRGGGRHHGGAGRRWKEKFAHLSPEEKEAFKQRFRERFGKSEC